MLGSQRFRHKQKSVEPIRQAKSGSNPERQTRADVSERPANGGTKNKTDTERDANHSKGSGAFFFWNDVGDVGHGCGNAGGRNSGNNAANK
jgi:hypothetical protein